jgi:hypothetical protein
MPLRSYRLEEPEYVCTASKRCEDKYYICGRTTLRVSDRYERLVMVAAEVLAMPCGKHLSQVSDLDSSSSRAAESIV